MSSPSTTVPVRAQPKAPAGLPPWLRHAIREGVHLALDAAAVLVAYRLAHLARFHWRPLLARFPSKGELPWSGYVRMLYAIVPLWLAVFWYSCKLYDSPWQSLADRFLSILKGCVLATGATLAATYVYDRLQYSRLILVLVLPLAAALATGVELVVRWLDSRLSTLESARPVLVVGSGPVARVVKERIQARHPGAEVVELRQLPEPRALGAALGEKPYLELILLRSSSAHANVLEAAEICANAGVAFKVVPDLLELRLGEVQMDESLGLPAYRLEHSQLTRLNFLSKRAFDVVFCLCVFAVLGLPLLLLAALIRLDSKGPALYKQKRYGLRGRVFEAYKFRTMVVDAEKRLAEVRALNDQKGAFFKAKNDPRVTRVGKWLRRFSLDEFPQFINVLTGDMSVVGPRPLAVTTGELEALERDFGAVARKRMNILPGITGLWQVSGRSDVDSEQRFSLDLFYIEHWSLGLDLEIILKTVPAMLLSKGAY